VNHGMDVDFVDVLEELGKGGEGDVGLILDPCPSTCKLSAFYMNPRMMGKLYPLLPLHRVIGYLPIVHLLFLCFLT
jgi:hypothetical protein